MQPTSKKQVVALDGPAGAGKSTIARIIAERLNFVYIDTGAMYRAVTLKTLDLDLNLDDETAIAEMIRTTKVNFDQNGKIFLDGVDVTDKIRSEVVTGSVSKVAGIPQVREFLQKEQRNIGIGQPAVLDGRDIGSAVFPDAKYKFYLDASLEERAQRRMSDTKEFGHSDLQQLVDEIAARDEADRNREHSPLVQAEDAIYIDSTGMDIEAVCQSILNRIANKHPEGVSQVENNTSQTADNDQLNLEMAEPQELSKGILVKGTVVQIDDEYVWVDVQYKQEGKIKLEEFDTPPEENDEIEVKIISLRDKYGDLLVSKNAASRDKMRSVLQDAYEKDEVLTGRVKAEAKKGLKVDFDGVEAYVPLSHMELGKALPEQNYIGNEYEFKIIQLEHRRNGLSVVASRRKILEERKEDRVKEVFEKISVGDVIEGTVKNLARFGVFVDIGGMDGLIHIDNLSWQRNVRPSEIAKPGDQLKVKVVEMNREQQRIGLSLKDLQEDPFVNFAAEHKVGDEMDGKVVKLETFGAFIEVAPQIEGLLHVSELSWTKRIGHPKQVLAPGQTVRVKLLGIDPQERRISLGYRQLMENPYDSMEQDYPVGSQHSGKISRITDFGIFIELPSGIDGLVRNEDLSWDKKNKDARQEFNPGDMVEVRVLSVDPGKKKIDLGIKQLVENPFEKFKFDHPVGSRIEGKVTNIVDFGAFVELAPGIEGMIHISHLSDKRVENVTDVLQEGEQVKVKILEIDENTGKISLSIKDYHKDEEMAVISQHKGTDSGTFRLGDMIDLSDLK